MQSDCDDLDSNPTNHKNSKSYLLTLVNPCRERVYSLRGDAGTANQPVDITFAEVAAGSFVTKNLNEVVRYTDGNYGDLGFSGNCASADWQMNVPTVTACKTNNADSDSTCDGQVEFGATALTV